MPTLQQTFLDEGNLQTSALKWLLIRFKYQDFQYREDNDPNGAISRITTGEKDVELTQNIADNIYGSKLSLDCITGDPDRYATLCYRYLQHKMHYNESLSLSDLTITFKPVFLTDEEVILGTGETQYALFFAKNLETEPPKDGGFGNNLNPAGTAGVTHFSLGDNNVSAEFPIEEAKRLFEKNSFLINRRAYDSLLGELGEGANAFYPLFVISYLIDITNGAPTPIANPTESDNAIVQEVFNFLGVADSERKLNIIKSYLSRLFDFPLTTKGIQIQKVAGTFTVRTIGNEPITADDLALYGVSLEYDGPDEDGQTVGRDLFLDWTENKNPITNNSIPFSFSDNKVIVPADPHETMTVFVRSADSTILWSNTYLAGSKSIENIRIEVAVLGAGPINPSEQTKSNTKRLRGQLIDMTQKVTLKDAIILVQAKTAMDGAWQNVASATSDSSGNFSTPFPYGVYVAAQALVSLMPDSPVAIAVNADTGKNCTISEDFLYLLLKDVKLPEKPAQPEKEDCDCNSNNVKASRLPDHTDLINSDEYTQDLGTGCMKLSTPNRTLREYSYQAVVRTSDPDVANYTLTKEIVINTIADQTNGNAQTTERFNLISANRKIKRKSVDLFNPVRWQDAPDKSENLSFYQAVTVSTGHILHYKSQFKADGYSLGELLYSLALAPGQKKQIVIFDAQHSLQGAENQQLSLSERLASNLVNDRNVSDQLSGTITEGMKGSSTATTAGISAAAGAAGSMGSVGGSLGVAGGWSNSNSDASQDSARNISQFFNEKLRNSIAQNADSYRQQNASVITTVSEGQKYAATTEVIANHNHCHSLTMMYFEVLKHYAIYQELSNVEECVFVPLLMTNFSIENIYKWRDVLAQNLMPLPSNTYLPAVDGMHPLAKAFDAAERVKTNWTNVDFPVASYGEDPIRYIKGNLSMSVNLQRPKTRYDRIISFPIVEHKEGGPSYWDVIKNAILAPFTAGLPVFGTDEKVVQAKSKIFDSFMTLDANYQNVAPADCIRVTNFQPVPIDPAIISLINAGPGAQSSVSGHDFFDGPDADEQTWMAIYTILNDGFKDVYEFLSHYFKDKLISEWDQIYYNDIAPELFDKIAQSLVLQQTTSDGSTIDGSISGLNASFTSLSRYRGGETTMYLNVYATTSTQRHNLGEKLKLISYNQGVKNLSSLVTLRLESLNLTYSTAHFNGPLFSGYIGQDIFKGAYIDIPETDADKRNPRTDDRFLVSRLIQHLNCNLEYYNKVLWYNLDSDRRYMLLDGFNIQIFNDFGVPIGLKSLASVIKNELITVAGNSLVFPVSAGFKVNKSYIVEKTAANATEIVSLLTHYKPLTPVPPYRISIPSKGVFAEAVNGSCNSCEKVEANTSQDWNVFKPDEPTAINALTAPTATVTDWKATFKDIASSTLKIQDAPTTPTPGAGLQGLSDALTKADTFKDLTGLSKNQENAMDTYKANTAAVVQMAEMAKGLATQEHNTDKSSQIMDKLKEARNSGAISDDDYNKLVKKHLEKQIDGSDDSDKDEEDAKKQDKKEEKDGKVTDATTTAINKGQAVEITEKDSKGNSKTVKIGAKPAASSDSNTEEKNGEENKMTTLTSVDESADIVNIELGKMNIGWAQMLTSLLNWKNKKEMTIEEAMKSLGDKYLKFYSDDKDLPRTELDNILTLTKLKGEAKAEYTLDNFVTWLSSYGPLWLTVGSDNTDGNLSSNSWIVNRIVGKKGGKLSDAVFEVLKANSVKISIISYEEMMSYIKPELDKDSKAYLRILHFPDKIVIDVTPKKDADASGE